MAALLHRLAARVRNAPRHLWLDLAGLTTVAAILMSWSVSRRTRVEWNVIEVVTGANLFDGNGFRAFLGSPPITWRQPVPVVLMGLLSKVFDDPLDVWRVLTVACVVAATCLTYLLGRYVWGRATGLVAATLVLSMPGVVHQVTFDEHANGPAVALVVLLGLVFAAVRVLEESTARRFLVFGAVAGLAYLTRVEGVIYAGLALGWVLLVLQHRERGSLSPRGRAIAALRRVAWFGLAWAVMALPWLLHLRAATGSLSLNGQGLYTFYNSEGWVFQTGGDVENTGYHQAVRIFGTIDENSGSMLRAILSAPSHALDRFLRNGEMMLDTLTSHRFLPAVVLPLAGLGLAIGRRRREAAVLLAAVSLGIVGLLLTYPDPRYITPVVPLLCLLAAVAVVELWRLLWGSTSGAGRMAASAVVATSFVGLLLVPTLHRVAEIVPQPERERLLAEEVPPGAVGPDDVLAIRGGGSDNLNVRYFGPALAVRLGTRFSWNVPDGPDDYPRSSVLSMTKYPDAEHTIALVRTADVFRYGQGAALTAGHQSAPGEPFVSIVRLPENGHVSLGQVLDSGLRARPGRIDLVEQARWSDAVPSGDLRTVTIDGVSRTGIFSHADGEVALRLFEPGGVLRFAYGIEGEAAWNNERPDGVSFEVYGEDADGSRSLLFDDDYVPRLDPVAPEWREAEVPLPVEDPFRRVVFVTGHRGNHDYDWSAWANVTHTYPSAPSDMATYDAVGSAAGRTLVVDGEASGGLVLRSPMSLRSRIAGPESSTGIIFEAVRTGGETPMLRVIARSPEGSVLADRDLAASGGWSSQEVNWPPTADVDLELVLTGADAEVGLRNLAIIWLTG